MDKWHHDQVTPEDIENFFETWNKKMRACGLDPETIVQIGSKLHRKTWRWFLDATPAQGGIVELHAYPAGAVDTFLCYHRANMVPAEKALTADHIPYYEGDTLHTEPAPPTRAMVEAYALLINTHIAKELDCTLERVSCELSGDMRTFNLPAHPAF